MIVPYTLFVIVKSTGMYSNVKQKSKSVGILVILFDYTFGFCMILSFPKTLNCSSEMMTLVVAELLS